MKYVVQEEVYILIFFLYPRNQVTKNLVRLTLSDITAHPWDKHYKGDV